MAETDRSLYRAVIQMFLEPIFTLFFDLWRWRPFIDVDASLLADRLRQWRDTQEKASNKAAFNAFRARALTHAEFNGGGYLYGSQNRLLLT